jgi:hypothetical protein
MHHRMSRRHPGHPNVQRAWPRPPARPRAKAVGNWPDTRPSRWGAGATKPIDGYLYAEIARPRNAFLAHVTQLPQPRRRPIRANSDRTGGRPGNGEKGDCRPRISPGFPAPVNLSPKAVRGAPPLALVALKIRLAITTYAFHGCVKGRRNYGIGMVVDVTGVASESDLLQRLSGERSCVPDGRVRPADGVGRLLMPANRQPKTTADQNPPPGLRLPRWVHRIDVYVDPTRAALLRSCRS